jgi:hypothetical protein
MLLRASGSSMVRGAEGVLEGSMALECELFHGCLQVQCSRSVAR